MHFTDSGTTHRNLMWYWKIPALFFMLRRERENFPGRWLFVPLNALCTGQKKIVWVCTSPPTPTPPQLRLSEKTKTLKELKKYSNNWRKKFFFFFETRERGSQVYQLNCCSCFCHRRCCYCDYGRPSTTTIQKNENVYSRHLTEPIDVRVSTVLM